MSILKNAQKNDNPYDDFAQNWHKTKTGGRHYAHELLEKPAMKAKLPNLQGKKVLALGCGDGHECEMLLEAGASYVLGVDSSSALIEQAKYGIGLGNEKLEFLVKDIAKLDLKQTDFEYVYSSLTLHYIQDWVSFLTNLKRFVKPEARFLFSTHHPAKWGARTEKNSDYNRFVLGYQKNKHNQEFEIYGDYLGFREIETELMKGLKVKFYHRSIQKIFKDIVAGGWQIQGLWEPKPVEKAKIIKPDFFEVHTKIPMFLVIELVQF
jgi:SAM-dependent methyltransferase